MTKYQLYLSYQSCIFKLFNEVIQRQIFCLFLDEKIKLFSNIFLHIVPVCMPSNFSCLSVLRSNKTLKSAKSKQTLCSIFHH